MLLLAANSSHNKVDHMGRSDKVILASFIRPTYMQIYPDLCLSTDWYLARAQITWKERQRKEHLEDRQQQLVSSVLLPPELVLAEAAQQLQVWPAVGELVLVLVHLGVSVCFDDCAVGEGFRYIPVFAQPYASPFAGPAHQK